jgi:diamine N-acetyltransferase
MISVLPVDTSNVGPACRITLKPGQDAFVAPVAVSLAEAYVQPNVAWPRVAVDDDGKVLGFAMGAFDPIGEPGFFRCGIWRLNVAADAQGRGVGRELVNAVLDEARRRGEGTRASTRCVCRDGGPEGFYRRIGFEPTGEEFHGHIVGAIDL